ncbi:hypothetical protein [Actinoplanes sp. ATCC 53533]|uniref:hypothetical protein n=1 Tax=Actinoplanes sp. ATCC 53533 TaxID=1288362 RepID=UPI000F7B5F44|nr:hypothetical protein [Actinoplanes sp. ATCC 53533]
MFFGRRRDTSSPFSTLREVDSDTEIWRSHRSGADVSVRRRLDEFRGLFRDHGFRLTPLRDPLCAASVGAALGAPFISITDLMGMPREIVLDAIVEMGTPDARAALLALAVATDGQLETLASRAAARMDRVDEPPWAQRARSPLTLLSTDRLLDQRDDRIVALVVAVGQGPNRACFFVRFHPGSLLTAIIRYLPETDRGTLLAELTAGQGPAAPYRFTRRLRATDDRDSLIALVGAMLEENELNLRMGTDFPPYPPDLAHLSRIGDVTVVPALLVLLRKLLLSAYGIATWKDVDSRSTAWI